MKNKNLIIILPGGINENGSLQNETKNRVKGGINLFKNQKENTFLVMPGRWSFMFKTKPATTEAQAMKKMAISSGVPSNKILLEEKSNDTIGNAYFTKNKFLKNKKWNKIFVVTSKYHLKRTKYIFKKIFGDDYKLNFVGVDDYKDSIKFKDKIKQEEKILKFTKKWLDKIDNGDDKKIKQFLLTEHPGYSKKAKYSTDELIKEVGIKAYK